MRIAPNERAFLAHWTYSTEEWERFTRWSKLRRGWLSYLLFRLFPGRNQSVPEIAITCQKVWIGDFVESFRSKERQLKRIHIRDTREMNILEIIYEDHRGKPGLSQIHIPIPKGKLREAMEVHENLSAFAW